MIQIYLDNVNCKLVGEVNSNTLAKLDKEMSYSHPGYQYMSGGRGGYGSQGKLGGWDGRVRLLTDSRRFPIGLAKMTQRILEEDGVEYEIVDQRPQLKYGTPIPLVEGSKYSLRDYQDGAIRAAKKHKSGIIKMATGCHAKGTEILMYDGTIKKVEDIVVGDQIMGPDSRPRNVLELCRGKDRMVKIVPTKGESFTINQDHILTLKRTRRRNGDKKAELIEDIKFSDWEKMNPYYKHIRKLFRVGVEFSKKELSIDPYFMGILLGDGSLGDSIGITSKDEEIISYCSDMAEKFGLQIRKSDITYFLTTGFHNRGKNNLINELRRNGLHHTKCSDKFIPQDYKTSSREDRLNLLAGLLDTDGHYTRKGYDFISKSQQLSNDVAFVCRSLGIAAYVSKQKKVCTNNGAEGFYYRVSISGNLDKIPCKIPRKVAEKRLQKKDVLVTGFKYEEAGYSDYYGFKVDSDNRYLMADFTVTHNSGKTLVVSSLVAQFNIPTIIYVIGIELLYQMRDTLKDAYGIEAGIVGGGICDTSKSVTIMTIWSAASAFDKKAQITENDTTGESNVKISGENKKNIQRLVHSAQLFIFDECQYAASETLQFLHKVSVAAKHRFLFSGTPWRDTGDDILIEAVSGPKIYDINATRLINEGHLVPPDIHFVNVPVIRNVGKNYHDVYKKYVVENDDRNDLIIKAARKLVAGGKKVLILVVRVPHGDVLMEKLQEEFKVKFLDGAKSTKDRLESIKAMKDGKIDILIASKIFDQGVDIPELDALILAGSGKSSGRALQRIGRVIRKFEGKKKAIVVEFYDNCKYLKDHSEARIKVYGSEPGFNIIMPKNQVLHSYPERGPVKWV